MTSDKTLHITVTVGANEYNNLFPGLGFAVTYAVGEDTQQELQTLGDQEKYPKGVALVMWLHNKGCQLDSQDGPALVTRSPFYGEREVAYYRDGKLHRDDGPAVTYHFGNGTTFEKYYREGKLHREHGPAIVERYATGRAEEAYYRDDNLIKAIERPAPKEPNKPGAPPAPAYGSLKFFLRESARRLRVMT